MAESTATGGFDQVLDRLRTVVERLEQGNLSLEDSLKAFEDGIVLARNGHALLEAAEKRVEILVRGPAGKAASTGESDSGDLAVPFSGGNGNGDGNAG